jgi:hypothetical protein
VELPLWDAWIVQVPADAMVTTLPRTVHTDLVDDAKLTGSPEVAVAPMVNGAVPYVRPGSGTKSIVWLASAAIAGAAWHTVAITASATPRALATTPSPARAHERKLRIPDARGRRPGVRELAPSLVIAAFVGPRRCTRLVARTGRAR